MRFTMPSKVLAYLPAGGAPAQLTTNLVDPATSSSGTFGGDVLALQFDVDFADAGDLPATSSTAFGDLRLCNLTTLGGEDVSPANGMTVRQVLAGANTVLGGGTATISVNGLDQLTRAISGAFEAGSPSAFAQDNVVNGSCA